jgi:DNA-binding NarL/FixJ family response regulator
MESGEGVLNVAIIEDHALQRERTEEVLRTIDGVRVVCRAESLPIFLDWLQRAHLSELPHLLVLDLMVDRGPAADPSVVANLIRSNLTVLVLSAMASPAQVRQVMRAGAAGFVGKRDSAADLVAAVEAVRTGNSWMTSEMASVIAQDPGRPTLSDQEERTLVLYASGLRLEAVAERIGVKRDTAKKYLERVKSKYAASGREVRTKTELYHAAVRDGFLDAP